MKGSLPLTALLSHLLVAFTIEFDNEAEHRTAPRLVSLAMWSNCMQFVDEKGVTVRDLEQAARTRTNLNGMVRWGYVTLEPGAAKAPRSKWLIRPTPSGRSAQETWRPLFATVEDRWRQRFGEAEVTVLRNSLEAIIDQLGIDLPDCLPILGYGLYSKLEIPQHRQPGNSSALPLPSLLSKVLLAFAIDFESESEVSLAICANVLRLIDPQAVPVRDLPHLAGVSKEGIAMALSFLQKRELAGGKGKVVGLTPIGEQVREKYFQLVRSIEDRWRTRFGADSVHRLRTSLEQFVSDRDTLFRALEPYPDGWRASLPQPKELPHYPMVLHRGGYPDGS